MAIPDSWLDTSWSVHYVSSTEPLPTLYNLLSRPQSSASLRRMKDLSIDCQEYLSSRGSAYKDELNDETEKTGQLRECIVDYVRSPETDTVSGLSIEAQYQKTVYRIVLVASQNLDANICPVSTILYKASKSHLKSVQNWLDDKFGLSSSLPLHFPVLLLPRLCSQFLSNLDETSAKANGGDELRQATLKQVVGTLKITFTFSNAAGSGIVPNLKTMDFDIPAETVGVLLSKAKKGERNDGYGFLDELAEALHDKTGLKLPLTEKVSDTASRNANEESSIDGPALEQLEPPLKITKIACAAFALRADGAVKLAAKPIQDAEIIGYSEDVVRKGYMKLLETIFLKAEKRQKNG